MFKVLSTFWRREAITQFRCKRLPLIRTSTTSSETPILVDKDGSITLIGLNRELTRNAIDANLSQMLCDAFHNFENDDKSSVGVLYGIGGSFCAGLDVAMMEEQLDRNCLDFLFRFEGSAGPTRRFLKKPVICAINGFCIGSGIELALLCDLRVMEENAVMGFFNRYLGVPISNGGTVRLSASVGYSRALDMILSGKRVYSEEALQIGLVNRVVATGTALGQAVNLAFCIEKFPAISLMHDRSSIQRNTFDKKSFNSAIQTELMHVTDQLLAEMLDGNYRFKSNEKGHGSKTHNWNIRERYVPDWEKVEMEYEKRKNLQVGEASNTESK